MTSNKQIINLQDKLIKGYKKEIDLLKQQNMLLKEKIALLSAIVDRQNQDLEKS